MKLIDAIAKIDKTDSKAQDWANIEHVSEALGLNVFTGHCEFAERMKKYWIHSWLSTDTWVGLAAYFFDDKLVATSFQPARKSSEEFTWYLQSDVEEIRSFILSLDTYSQPEFGSLDDTEYLNETFYRATAEQAIYSVFKEKDEQ